MAFELANRGVPTVVGFRWDLEDKYAAEYSKAFFDELLLKDLSLERAFLKARQAMNFQGLVQRGKTLYRPEH